MPLVGGDGTRLVEPGVFAGLFQKSPCCSGIPARCGAQIDQLAALIYRTPEVKRKKREIIPPLREWPPIPAKVAEAEDLDHTIDSRLASRNGLAGADDIVRWLAQLMNKKGVSYDQLSHRSGVPSRTIKKWFSGDENARTIPKLNTIQACFEALGQSLIVSPPSVQIGSGENIYAIETFRHQILEEWLEQSARARDVSVADFIEDWETKHRRAIRNRTKGFRRREF